MNNGKYTIDHIGVVVADLDAAVRTYVDSLGFRQLYRETIAHRGVEVVGLTAGDSTIELIRPLDASSPVARYRGDAPTKLHHVGYRVANLDGELARVRAAGVRLIDEKPQAGAHGLRGAFLHPASTAGVLIELCQHQHSSNPNPTRDWSFPKGEASSMVPLMMVATALAGVTIGWALGKAQNLRNP